MGLRVLRIVILMSIASFSYSIFGYSRAIIDNDTQSDIRIFTRLAEFEDQMSPTIPVGAKNFVFAEHSRDGVCFLNFDILFGDVYFFTYNAAFCGNAHFRFNSNGTVDYLGSFL